MHNWDNTFPLLVKMDYVWVRPCKEEESKKGGEGSMPGEDRLQDQDRLWPMSRQPGDILALAVAVARMSDVAVESETGEE